MAAVSKLRDLASVREQMRELSLPSVAAPGLAAVELGTVVLMVAVPWGAWCAVVLLGAFTVVILVALARGSRAPCPCFGADSAPISARSVLRNGWLLALAVVATGSSTDASVAATAGFVAVLAAITVVLVRTADQVRDR